MSELHKIINYLQAHKSLNFVTFKFLYEIFSEKIY